MLVVATVLLIVTPVTISANVALVETVVLLAGLCVALLVEFVLLRRAFAPLEQLAKTMQTVDLLRPGQRVPAPAGDAIGRVVASFNDMLERLETERRESGSRALAAQEADRSRIARGLHDEVGQVLTAVLLELNALGPSLADDRQQELAETKATVRRALEEVRRISRELRPEILEELGLVSALTELSSAFGRRGGLRVERDFDQALPPLSEEAELALYRVAQESLTNVMRHAGASQVLVSLRHVAGALRLIVRDDGRGLPTEREPAGAGIAGMQERALHIGARLTISSEPSGGTEVRLDVPLPEGPP